MFQLSVTASDEDYNTKLTFSVDNDHFRVQADNPSSTQMPQTATIYVNKYVILSDFLMYIKIDLLYKLSYSGNIHVVTI
jgi:hypothetical protein